LEAVYQEALALELTTRVCLTSARWNCQSSTEANHSPPLIARILFASDPSLSLKALAKLTRLEEAQLINYLKASGHRVCVLLNFGA
jgi:GxxExxY protein